MKKSVMILVALAAGSCAPQVPPRHTSAPLTPASPIDTTAIRGYTRFLSDNALLGRGTGTPEGDIAALYIEAACTEIGFAPISDKSYLQPVSMQRTTISPSGTNLVLSGPRGTRSYAYRAGFLPNLGFDGGKGFAGPGVFIGTSEDVTTGKLKDLNMRGAVVAIAGPLTDAADDTLDARGIAGLIQLTGDESQYLLYVRSRGDSRLRLSDTTIQSSFPSSQVSVVASPRVSRDLVSGMGSARGPVALEDSISLSLNLDHKPVTASNVGCMLEGSDPKLKDSAIVFTAHYDHLGVGVPDSRGDSIYNGFSDNAAGVAMLLSIGNALSKRVAGPPRHTIILLFFTGEEQGLLGSDYYVAHPLWPLQKIRGVINLDAGAPPARPWSWRIAANKSPLSQLAQDVAADHGWSATTSAATPNSDYFPFSRAGVQAIFIVPGSAPYQGLSADSSQALRRRWDHYHEPADEWAVDFPFAGLGRYAEFAYFIARAMDGQTAGDRRAGPISPH